MTVDLSHKLRSGITIGELMERAEAWWDKNGRHLVPREFTAIKSERVRTGAGVPMLRIKDEVTDEEGGGILTAKPWAELTGRERSIIAVRWHDGVLLRGRGDGRIMPTDQVAPWPETEH